MAGIAFRKVSKVFGDVPAVSELTLKVADGELMVIVGPSGCGKSTLLRLVAGLDELSAGEIYIGNELVNHLTPQERNVAMVFQNYALYPHKSVRQNLEFPLRMMGIGKRERHERVARVAEKLGIEAFLERKPTRLSGGQQQRVAMGRAIVRDPRAFLMDEPLSNLDAQLRTEIRTEIAELQRELGITTIYVTHDQVEAMTLGDRIAVLRAGRLQQVDSARGLYDRPVNSFVAAFIGGPSMNLFRSRLRAEQEQYAFAFGEQWIPVAAAALTARGALRRRSGEPLLLGLRPEAFVASAQVDARRRIAGTVQATEELGHERIVYFTTAVARLAGWVSSRRQEPDAGMPDGEVSEPSPFAARLPVGCEVPRRGDLIELGIDTSQLHFFDIAGEAIRER
jgi:multiple sugar transport system ATP-binding protein